MLTKFPVGLGHVQLGIAPSPQISIWLLELGTQENGKRALQEIIIQLWPKCGPEGPKGVEPYFVRKYSESCIALGGFGCEAKGTGSRWLFPL